MSETDILDENAERLPGSRLKEAVTWWEKRRWWFNVAIGAAGLLGIYLSGGYFLFPDFVGIILWALFVNLLYCAGLLAEIFDEYYFRSRLVIHNYRMILFVLGTLAGIFVTIVVAVAYFAAV